MLSRNDWKEEWHRNGFGDYAFEDAKDFNFPIVYLDDEGDLVGYITVKELDAESATINFGATMTKYRGHGLSKEGFRKMVEVALGVYKRLIFLCTTKNKPMIKLGIYENFEIIGMRVIYGLPHLEFLLEREA